MVDAPVALQRRNKSSNKQQQQQHKYAVNNGLENML